MKLLIVTQVVDTEDTYLGFFHEWINALATEFESIEVICLKEGTHALPDTVRVHSLGKEKGKRSPLAYAGTFFSNIWKLRNKYDVVYVHQNEEYLLIGGLVWKVLGKRAYLWRNHYAGSWKTSAAAMLSTRVFYTSFKSYTARFKNAVRMPVGVDVARFVRGEEQRERCSILSIGRIAPSKRIEMTIEALALLAERGIAFNASIVGDALPEDAQYKASLVAQVKAHGLSDRITFLPGVAHADVPAVLNAHSIFVNCAPSGMFDKTLFEAAATGLAVYSTSNDWQELLAPHKVHFEDAETLTELLMRGCSEGVDELRRAQEHVVRDQSLQVLAARLKKEFVRE